MEKNITVSLCMLSLFFCFSFNSHAKSAYGWDATVASRDNIKPGNTEVDYSYQWVDTGIQITIPTYPRPSGDWSDYLRCKPRMFCSGGDGSITKTGGQPRLLTSIFWKKIKKNIPGSNEKVEIALVYPSGRSPNFIRPVWIQGFGYETKVWRDMKYPTSDSWRDADEITDYEEEHAQRCQAYANCAVETSGYFESGYGNPHLFIKLPKNLNKNEIDLDDIFLEFHHRMDGSEDPAKVVSLRITGKIALPEQCYTYIQETVGTNHYELDFGDVSLQQGNGYVDTRKLTLKSQCYNAPKVKQEIALIPRINNDNVLQNENVFGFPDANGNVALGFIFGLRDETLNCNTPARKYNNFIELNQFTDSTAKFDVLNFQLCKYGMPTLLNTQSATVNLNVRWTTL